MRLTVLATIVLGVLALAKTGLAQRCGPEQIVNPGGSFADNFGYSVAISGDAMIVGANRETIGANVYQGTARVYRWSGTAWALEATLIAADGVAFSYFGWSVAIEGDTAVVGADDDTIGGSVGQGSAYVFVRSGGVWMQEAKLIASDGVANDRFGHSVAVSGNTVVIGSIFDQTGGNVDQGSAYVYVRSGVNWNQQTKLTAADGAAGDLYGRSVAVGDNTIVVGASAGDVGGNTNQGSAYVYTRSGTVWSQQAKLTANDGEAGDFLGSSAAISGETLIVGAYNDQVNSNNSQGSAYVFARSGSLWIQQAKLVAADGAALDRFGYSVALFGDTAVVGADNDSVATLSARGSAYVFTRSGPGWNQQAELFAPDGASFDNFGYSVAISGNRVVVGSPFDNIGENTDQGSVWVFARNGGGDWIGGQRELWASDGVPSDQLGYAVAVQGDTMAVGAVTDDNGAAGDQGSVYTYARLNGVWVQDQKLIPSGTPLANTYFGAAVAVDGNYMVVGAPIFESDRGAAYVFFRNTAGTWTQQTRLEAFDRAPGDRFGSSVAIHGNTIVVGAALWNTSRGAAYVFTRSGSTWSSQGRLDPSDRLQGDRVGTSVAIQGDTIAVGAVLDDVSVFDEGSVYIFTRNEQTWTQRAQLIASDPSTGAEFGGSIALSGDTLVVGAVLATAGSTSPGAAYVFRGSDAVWSFQSKLVAGDRNDNDNFGRAVSIDGDTVLVGSARDDFPGQIDRGSAYVFARLGSAWTERSKLFSPAGASGDFYGYAVALSGQTAVMGAPNRQVGANIQQGAVHVTTAASECTSTVRNLTLETSYTTLAAALLPAQSGHQIIGSAEAWSSITSLDTLGRSIGFSSSAWLATPEGSTLTLGGSSFLAAASGEPVEVYGQLRTSANASADVVGSGFVLGSRGILTARTGSSLTISAPTASLSGQTRLEQGSALTFAGAAANSGLLTASVNSTISADGPISSSDELFLTAGTIAAPSYTNTGATSIFGASAVFGDYINGSGATTTIRSGSLFVFGSLTNNGTIVGTICANCSGSSPSLDVVGSLTLGAGANLVMPFSDSFVRLGGSFDCAIDSNTRFDLSVARLEFEGTGAEQTLEAMSLDRGRCASGLNRNSAGNYPVGTLHIGPNASVLRLLDAHDNGSDGQARDEAVYVDTLRIDAGSRLANGTVRVYCNTLVNNGVIDSPGRVYLIGPTACRADFNNTGAVSVQDIFDFLAAYFAQDPIADANCSGTITVQDIFDFLGAYFAGC